MNAYSKDSWHQMMNHQKKMTSRKPEGHEIFENNSDREGVYRKTGNRVKDPYLSSVFVRVTGQRR